MILLLVETAGVWERAANCTVGLIDGYIDRMMFFNVYVIFYSVYTPAALIDLAKLHGFAKAI